MMSVYGDDHPSELSPPAPREEVHNRRIAVNGFVREDGLYDIEAELTDHKTYSFPSAFRGDVTPDSPVHHMKVRITITPELEITAAEAVTIAGPYEVCPTATDIFDNLVGLTIGPGWRRKVASAIAGRHGCTHITELMGPVATIAYQTRFGEEARRNRDDATDNSAKTGDADSQTIGGLANSCVGYAIDE